MTQHRGSKVMFLTHYQLQLIAEVILQGPVERVAKYMYACSYIEIM